MLYNAVHYSKHVGANVDGVAMAMARTGTASYIYNGTYTLVPRGTRPVASVEPLGMC